MMNDEIGPDHVDLMQVLHPVAFVILVDVVGRPGDDTAMSTFNPFGIATYLEDHRAYEEEVQFRDITEEALQDPQLNYCESTTIGSFPFFQRPGYRVSHSTPDTSEHIAMTGICK